MAVIKKDVMNNVCTFMRARKLFQLRSNIIVRRVRNIFLCFNNLLGVGQMKSDHRKLFVEIACIIGLLIDIDVFLYLFRHDPFGSSTIQNVAIMISFVLFIALFYKLRQLQGSLSILELIALNKPLHPRDFVIGILSMMFGVILGLTYWLLFSDINNFYFEVAFIPILVLVLVSVIEEIWFRGIVHGSILHLDIGGIMGKFGDVMPNREVILEALAVTVGAISFVVYHFVSRGNVSPVNIFVLLLGGVILGMQRTITKSIIPPVLTHVCYNLVLMALLPI